MVVSLTGYTIQDAFRLIVGWSMEGETMNLACVASHVDVPSDKSDD